MVARWFGVPVLALLILGGSWAPSLPRAQETAPLPSTDVWTVLALDPPGDVRDPALPDLAQLSFRYDSTTDVVWFRLGLYGKRGTGSIAANIAIDSGEEGTPKSNWWGTNRDFKFDRLITVSSADANAAWLARACSAPCGLGDTSGGYISSGVEVHAEDKAIIIGVKRELLTKKSKFNVVVSVGSAEQWNDDIPNNGRPPATIDVAAARPSRGLREIDFTRNNLAFVPGYKTIADSAPPKIVVAGRGRIPLVLVTSVYSGAQPFQAFIARNEARYKFYIVTPPGMYGTPARAMPSENTSYGELTWTRLLKRDLIKVMRDKRLVDPVIVVHGYPGSLAAEEAVSENPGLAAGIVEVASMPIGRMASGRDPAKQPTPEERITLVDEAWARQWFKYVTPETWLSNNYRAVLLMNDPNAAEQVRREIEAAPLPVKIRYLIEYMASDHGAILGNIPIPVLVLRPGFDQQLLADPINSGFKPTFIDAWDAFSGNPQIKIETVNGARVRILDDQPTRSDELIAAFIARVEGKRSQAMCH